MGVAEQQRDILLVEDSPADATLVRMALREYGHLPCRLHVVPDGEAALAFLRHEGFYAGMPRPDLIILDIGLPKLGGWQVLKTLRNTPALARIPVVMLTGARMDTDEVQRERFRPLAYFVKPLFLREYSQLVEQLEQLLEGEAELGSREADAQDRGNRPMLNEPASRQRATSLRQAPLSRRSR